MSPLSSVARVCRQSVRRFLQRHADLGTLAHLMVARGTRRPAASDPSSTKPSPRGPNAARLRADRRRGPASDVVTEEAATGELVVKPDPLRQKLTALAKEHDKLLREITKKRAQLSTAESLVRDISSSLAAQTAPIRERLLEAIEGIQKSFKDLLSGPSRLNRRDKTKVRRVYEDVAEVFGFHLENDAPETLSPDDFPRDDHEYGHTHSGKREHFREPERGGGYSAPKPSETNASTLRTLFRRLAIAFHPDKVQDEEAKAERTSLMKDVTRAYESGDLARLMELERTLLTRAPIEDDADGLTRRTSELTKANAELRRQLRALTSDLKAVSAELPLDVNLKAQNAAEVAAAEIATLVKELESEERRVSTLRDFVRDFAAGKMDLATFLAGPTFEDEDSDDDDDFELSEDELLMVFLDDLLPKTRAAKRRPSSRRR